MLAAAVAADLKIVKDHLTEVLLTQVVVEAVLEALVLEMALLA
tara:strand:+ start:340 stop:468 length:129 start_codon:yes stop_codon:yes gene_type:complete